MPMLIYFNAEDLKKQAEASTKRFQRGWPQAHNLATHVLLCEQLTIHDCTILIFFEFKWLQVQIPF
jgi:hypothetical protein